MIPVKETTIANAAYLASMGNTKDALMELKSLGISTDQKTAIKAIFQSMGDRPNVDSLKERISQVFHQNAQPIHAPSIELENIKNGIYCLTPSFEVHPSAVRGLVIQGETAYSFAESSVIKGWDLNGGKLPKTFEGHDGDITAITVCGYRLCSGDLTGVIKIWDRDRAICLKTLHLDKPNTSTPEDLPVGQLILDLKRVSTPSGPILVQTAIMQTPTGLTRKEVMTPPMSEEQISSILKAHQLKKNRNPVSSIAISGNLLYSGDEKGRIKVWDITQEKCLVTLESNRDTASNVSCLAMGSKELYSCRADGTIEIWDLSTHNLMRHLEGHKAPVSHLAFSDNKLCSYSLVENLIKVWDLGTGECLHNFQLSGLFFKPFDVANNRLYFWDQMDGYWEQTLKVWDLQEGKELNSIPVRGIHVSSCAVSNEGKLCLTSEDGAMKTMNFNVEQRQVLQELIELFRRQKKPVSELVAQIQSLPWFQAEQLQAKLSAKDKIEMLFPKVLPQEKAKQRFLTLPEESRNKIYKEMGTIRGFSTDDLASGKNAFLDLEGLTSSPEEKAQAIENYLKSLS